MENMSKLGLHALVWVGGWSHEECRTAITKTAELGYDYIEIPALDPSSIDVKFTHTQLKENELGATVSLGLPRHADISSICVAFNMEIVKNKIKSVRIAYGGMAAIPKRAIYCEKIFLNSLVTDGTIDKAKKALEKDFKPINDMRASRIYRMEVAKNLLEKFYAEIKQKKINRSIFLK